MKQRGIDPIRLIFKRFRLNVHDAVKKYEIILCLKREFSAKQFVGQRSERVLVGAGVLTLSLKLFRTHVRAGSAGTHSNLRDASHALAELGGETEVNELNIPELVEVHGTVGIFSKNEHDVSRFNVAVNDVSGVSVIESFRHRAKDFQRADQRYFFHLTQVKGERHAIHESHHQIGTEIRMPAQGEGRADVLVVKGVDGLSRTRSISSS